jgi:hypothetical protein
MHGGGPMGLCDHWATGLGIIRWDGTVWYESALAANRPFTWLFRSN